MASSVRAAMRTYFFSLKFYCLCLASALLGAAYGFQMAGSDVSPLRDMNGVWTFLFFFLWPLFCGVLFIVLFDRSRNWRWMKRFVAPWAPLFFSLVAAFVVCWQSIDFAFAGTLVSLTLCSVGGFLGGLFRNLGGLAQRYLSAECFEADGFGGGVTLGALDEAGDRFFLLEARVDCAVVV